jgi:hypothetical protein
MMDERPISVRLAQPIQARIEAIEARQRAYGLHDPDCKSFAVDLRHWRTGGWVQLKPGDCTCWLADTTAPS